jgi:hypothetical protein
MPQEERRKDMQKNILVIAAICVCIFAFSIVLVMPPVSAAFSSIDIIDQTPTVLHPGDTKGVILTVKNIGNRDARAIRLEFQVEDKKNVSLVGDTVYQVRALNSGNEKKVIIKDIHVEEGTPDGIYHIPIYCYWDECYSDPSWGYICKPHEIVFIPDPQGYYREGHRLPVKMGISFIVKGEPKIIAGNVYTTPTHVRSGDADVVINVEIGNIGEADASDIEAKLICNNQLVPAGTGAERSYITRLNAGERRLARFNVDIAEDVKAGVYSIPLVIQYKDTGNVEYELEKSIDVVVEGKPKLEVLSHYTEPTNISAGDYVRLHVKVRNTGSEAAKSVSVRVTEAADAPFNFSKKSDNVDDLKVNNVGNAILEFSVDANATNRVYPQGLEIRCAGDPDAGNYTFDEKIQLEVFSGMPEGSPDEPSSSTPGFEALFSLMAILIISGFLLCIKKRK